MSRVRHYAAGAIVLCSNATADGTSNRYFGRHAEVGWDQSNNFRHLRIKPMAALAVRRPNSAETVPTRGALLRWLDTLAAWQMRHSHEVISRVQADSATITGVTQPSSANERSSTSPCDR